MFTHFWKRNTGVLKTYSATVPRPPLRMKICSSEEISWKQSNAMADHMPYMPRQQFTRIQGSQASTTHRDGPQEALQERGSDVQLDRLR